MENDGRNAFRRLGALFRRVLVRPIPAFTTKNLIVQTESWNGYEREAAIHELERRGDGRAVSALLVRANDWVPQVRSAAKTALAALMVPGNVKYFVQSLPDVYHLQHCRRESHDTFIRHVEDFLSAPENVQQVIDETKKQDAKTAKSAARLLLSRGLIDGQTVLSDYLTHSSVAVRVLAFEHLRHLGGAAFEDGLEISLRDSFMPLRRDAFLQLLTLRPQDRVTLARRHLFDSHVSIRTPAVKVCKDEGQDVYAIYKTVLGTEKTTTARRCYAIWGIGETGNLEDVDAIRRWFDTGTPRVQIYALRALVRLQGKDARPVALAALQGASRSLAREASRLIVKVALPVTLEELLSITRNTQSEHTLSACLHVALRMNKWNRLILLLCAFDRRRRANAEFRRQATDLLRSWDETYNADSSSPSADQVALLRDFYRDCDLPADDGLQRQIAFSLKGQGVIDA